MNTDICYDNFPLMEDYKHITDDILTQLLSFRFILMETAKI